MAMDLRTELSVEYEDPAVPATAGELLGNAGVNIHGYTCEGDEAGGVIRFMTEDPEGAAEALELAGFASTQRTAVVTPTPNEPGEFGRAARFLVDHGLTVATSYVVLDPASGLPQLAFTVHESDEALRRAVEG